MIFSRFLLACALLPVCLPAAPRQTALDKYVAAPDSNYRYVPVSKIQGTGYTAYVLDMTSQAWRTEKEVSSPLWKHWVTIIRPERVKSDTGFLYITGGSNMSKPPVAADPMLWNLAVDTGTVVTELRMVPNQPLTFSGESSGRSEDSLIAYAWDKYLRGGDDRWLPRLPMTKAAVRAMDTVASFCEKEGVKVSKFVVAGGSKRGWTTWTTAAADKRVIGILPLVIDLLNIQPSFEHHWRVYGFWAPAIADYERAGIMNWSRHPRYHEMMKIVEPYEYRDRLTMPKFLINATGDQFFLPDSWQFYWDDLKGEKYLRYVPNADHSLRGSDAIASLNAYYSALVTGAARPKFKWKLEKDGTIRVKSETKPEVVKLWQATNPNARDFRLEKVGRVWKEAVLEPAANGTYEARVAPPEKGYTAYMIEMTYPGGGKHPFKFTTGVKIVPDVLPYGPFQPQPVESARQSGRSPAVSAR
jgi:PhoPQ-activated pathogenicity-related protein